MVYVIAAISIILGSLGQFGLKVGANQVKTEKGLVAALLSLVLNPNIILSLICFAASMVIWVFVLRKLELSVAYPMVSMGYIITMALAFLYLNEPLRLTKLLGAALIISGVLVINMK